MENARLDEVQTVIKTPRRNINNLRNGRKERGAKEPLDDSEREE